MQHFLAFLSSKSYSVKMSAVKTELMIYLTFYSYTLRFVADCCTFTNVHTRVGLFHVYKNS